MDQSTVPPTPKSYWAVAGFSFALLSIVCFILLISSSSSAVRDIARILAIALFFPGWVASIVGLRKKENLWFAILGLILSIITSFIVFMFALLVLSMD